MISITLVLIYTECLIQNLQLVKLKAWLVSWTLHTHTHTHTHIQKYGFIYVAVRGGYMKTKSICASRGKESIQDDNSENKSQESVSFQPLGKSKWFAMVMPDNKSLRKSWEGWIHHTCWSSPPKNKKCLNCAQSITQAHPWPYLVPQPVFRGI